MKLSVTRLRLHNFRNYTELELKTSSKIMVITGANGAGKTNILEAISLLTAGKGLRGAKLGEMAQAGANKNWVVTAQVETQEGTHSIGTSLLSDETGEKRIIKIDGKEQRGQSLLASLVRVIWLTPQMDGVFLDAASERRKFFDRLISNFDPLHLDRIGNYEAAMRDRLKLLKEGKGDDRWLSALEARMAEVGVAIAAMRIEVIGYLMQAINEASTSFLRPEILIDGEVEKGLQNALKAEEEFMGRLKSQRAIDAESGRTNSGVHKTDFIAINPIKNIPAALSSTGEQKAMLLSIILAVARMVSARKLKSPIILLDEVVAHLDEARRNELYRELQNSHSQCFLTGTEDTLFAGLLGDVGYCQIGNSKLVNVT